MTEFQEYLNQTIELRLALQQKLIESAESETLNSDSILSDLKAFVCQLQELNTKAFIESVNKASSVDELQKFANIIQAQTKLTQQIDQPDQQVDEEDTESLKTVYSLQNWLIGILNIAVIDSLIGEIGTDESTSPSPMFALPNVAASPPTTLPDPDSSNLISYLLRNKKLLEALFRCSGPRCG